MKSSSTQTQAAGPLHEVNTEGVRGPSQAEFSALHLREETERPAMEFLPKAVATAEIGRLVLHEGVSLIDAAILLGLTLSEASRMLMDDLCWRVGPDPKCWTHLYMTALENLVGWLTIVAEMEQDVRFFREENSEYRAWAVASRQSQIAQAAALGDEPGDRYIIEFPMPGGTDIQMKLTVPMPYSDVAPRGTKEQLEGRLHTVTTWQSDCVATIRYVLGIQGPSE